jgi:hypothetical protein
MRTPRDLDKNFIRIPQKLFSARHVCFYGCRLPAVQPTTAQKFNMVEKE